MERFPISGARDLDIDHGSVKLHSDVHHSSTATYTPNFIEIEETFCGQTAGRTTVRYVRMHVRIRRTDILRPALLSQL